MGSLVSTPSSCCDMSAKCIGSPIPKAIGGGVKGQNLDFFGLDLDRSKFYILLCAFDRISKFGPVDPKFADLWGWVGPKGVYFSHMEKFYSAPSWVKLVFLLLLYML